MCMMSFSGDQNWSHSIRLIHCLLVYPARLCKAPHEFFAVVRQVFCLQLLPSMRTCATRCMQGHQTPLSSPIDGCGTRE